MEILFHVSTAAGARLLTPLAQACRRAGCGFGVFFTHEGVLELDDAALQAALQLASRAVACEDSWHRMRGHSPCPVEAGSQTINSALMGEARRVVSL